MSDPQTQFYVCHFDRFATWQCTNFDSMRKASEHLDKKYQMYDGTVLVPISAPNAGYQMHALKTILNRPVQYYSNINK